MKRGGDDLYKCTTEGCDGTRFISYGKSYETFELLHGGSTLRRVDWGFHKGGGSPWFCEECEEEIKLPDKNVTEIVGHDGLDLDYHHP